RLRQGQSDTDAAQVTVLVFAFGYLEKFLKDIVNLCRGDADTVVLDADRKVGLPGCRGMGLVDAYPHFRSGNVKGIDQQVVQDLGEGFRIGLYPKGAHLGTERKFEPFLVGYGGEPGIDGMDERHELDGFGTDVVDVALDTPEIEQLIDQV